MRLALSIVFAGGLALSACDEIRYPGDGGPTPERPIETQGGGVTPVGAPGPPPPSEPVTDPYGQGEPPAEPTQPDVSENDISQPDLDDGDTAEPEIDDSVPPEPSPEEDTPAETPDVIDSAADAPASQDDPADGTDTASNDAPVENTDNDANDTSAPDIETPATELEDEPVEAETPDVQTDEQTPEETGPVEEVVEPTFSYLRPGDLIAGSGTGSPSLTIHSPDMVFPIKSAAAYPQSMVWRYGGGIGGGDECDPRNYTYPWQDNFCEKRSSNRNSPFCPLDRIHQGQDIRVGTAEGCNQMRRADPADRTLYEVVAVEDGIISNIGSYTVNLRAGGRIYRYMHMNMRKLEVSLDQEVKAGDVLGYVSKDFGGSATTFHLHFEIIQNTAEHGWTHVSPYTSLVAAYERREGGPGEEVETNVSIASSRSFDIIPDDFIITE